LHRGRRRLFQQAGKAAREHFRANLNTIGNPRSLLLPPFLRLQGGDAGRIG
jgi:hypothetical protein